MILFFGPHTGSNYTNFDTVSQQTPCIRCHMKINSKHRRADPRLQGPSTRRISSESSSFLRPHSICLPSALAPSWASLRCPCQLASELCSPWLPQAILCSNTQGCSPWLPHPPSSVILQVHMCLYFLIDIYTYRMLYCSVFLPQYAHV
jgi:hypothetical protein